MIIATVDSNWIRWQSRREQNGNAVVCRLNRVARLHSGNRWAQYSSTFGRHA
jgi:hypothetical protein